MTIRKGCRSDSSPTRRCSKYLSTTAKSVILQIAPTSRGDVQAYQDIRHQLETAAGRINGQFGQLGWTPLYYLNQHFDRKLMKVFRYSTSGW